MSGRPLWHVEGRVCEPIRDCKSVSALAIGTPRSPPVPSFLSPPTSDRWSDGASELRGPSAAVAPAAAVAPGPSPAPGAPGAGGDGWPPGPARGRPRNASVEGLEPRPSSRLGTGRWDVVSATPAALDEAQQLQQPQPPELVSEQQLQRGGSSGSSSSGSAATPAPALPEPKVRRGSRAAVGPGAAGTAAPDGLGAGSSGPSVLDVASVTRRRSVLDPYEQGRPATPVLPPLGSKAAGRRSSLVAAVRAPVSPAPALATSSPGPESVPAPVHDPYAVLTAMAEDYSRAGGGTPTQALP